MLRVISGSARGHKLKTPKGLSTRPTTDRVKESVFNIISAYIEDADILDLFSGTGSLGIEALSRGAHRGVFVDESRECYGIIKDNLIHTKLNDNAEVFTNDCVSAVKLLGERKMQFNIIFMDPPYSKNLVEVALNSIEKNDIIKFSGLIVAEHRSTDIVPESAGKLVLVRRKEYGETAVSFYKCSGEV
ncbi:MAG: 16S rRNA (guanine(966)-N(2))-methyltransferase RsmD [Bacillota bacterium]|nr:16S rRNA (guanine(966)-N(2))-methyltransferase RsmD [Bacillota bacterium]